MHYSSYLFISIMGLFFISCAHEDPSSNRPNILFIMSDDHAYQAISSYDGSLNKTPNIDRLAQEGMLFQQSFVTNSICAPSRAVMLTGKYSHINGTIDNRTTFDGNQTNFVKLLNEAGYSTAIVGKWHLRSEPTGFDYWNILPGQGQYYNPDFIEMGEKKRVEGYVTNLTTDFALDWLDGRDKEKPFCLLLHHKAPHRNWMPEAKYLTKYDDVQIPEPETLFDNYETRGRSAYEQTMEIDDDLYIDDDLKVPVYPEDDHLKREKISNDSWGSIYTRMNEEQKLKWDAAYGPKNDEFKKSKLEGEELARWKYQRYIKDYLRCIASVDDNIGRVIDYLKENNLYENTVIVYTSDQGFYLGEHGWFDKRFMYEQSHKTPFIIKAPDGKMNVVNKEDMIVNIDYAPTFLDYAGVLIPEDMQGKSLRPVLNGETPPDWRTSVYYHYFEYPAEHGVKRHYGIRNSRYKLIHFYYDVDEWEFYDLEKDPNEIQNVYFDPAYQSIISELKEELQYLREQYQDTDEKEYLPKGPTAINHKGVGSKVSFKFPYNEKYPGKSPNTLLDGWHADNKTISIDRTIWQGFEKNDMVATIDLGGEVEINSISAGFLHNIESWIFSPDEVVFYVSEDKINFEKMGSIARKVEVDFQGIKRVEYELKLKSLKTRYFKIHAKNVGVCPSWHKGAGNPAWLFADEIVIN
ncbi:MAG: sulfatase/phosphatase domain-containing protein [Bacteroidota bacterium]